MFKLLIASCIFAICYARTPLEIRQFMLSKSIQCTKDHPVSTEEMITLMDHHLPNTMTSNCFIACVFKKFGWMNEKGMYDLDVAHQFAEDEYKGDAAKTEDAKKVFDTCKGVNDESPADGEAGCDRANSLAKCLLEHGPKMGFHLQ